MHEQSRDSGRFRNVQGSEDRVFEQAGPNPLALVIVVDRQAPEHDHRNRIRHVSLHRFRRRVAEDRSSGEAVIPNDVIVDACHERASGAAQLTLPRTAAEPFVQIVDATIKGIEVVLIAKRLRCRNSISSHSHGAFVSMSRRSSSDGEGGASSHA